MIRNLYILKNFIEINAIFYKIENYKSNIQKLYLLEKLDGNSNDI